MEAEPAGPPDAPQRPPCRPFACRRRWPASAPAPLPTHGPSQHVGGKGQLPPAGPAWLRLLRPLDHPVLLDPQSFLSFGTFFSVCSSIRACPVLFLFFLLKKKVTPFVIVSPFVTAKPSGCSLLSSGFHDTLSPASSGPCSPVAPESSPCCSSAFNSAGRVLLFETPPAPRPAPAPPPSGSSPPPPLLAPPVRPVPCHPGVSGDP